MISISASSLLSTLAVAASARAAAVAAHELAHYIAAWFVGRRASIRIRLVGLGESSTLVPGIEKGTVWERAAVRHAGWMFSVALAAWVSTSGTASNAVVSFVCWLVASEALASDLLLWSGGERFFCGNFGLLLLDKCAAPLVKQLLRTMLRVTMMRGAQSAGLVTYKKGSVGLRKRVVNGKRTDLCDLLMTKFESELKPGAFAAPALFQGHTRFATSSIANLEGCHPHQWLPPCKTKVWSRDEKSGTYKSSHLRHECFITHNGDLDFFEWHGTVYPLDDVFMLLESFLGKPKPAPVDSAGVAGLLDLLRCKGMWLAAVRYGYVFGGLANAGNLMAQRKHLWSSDQLHKTVSVFEAAWAEVLRETGDATLGKSKTTKLRVKVGDTVSKGIDLESALDSSNHTKGFSLGQDDRSLHDAMVKKLLKLLPGVQLHLPPSVGKQGVEAMIAAAELFIRKAVGAFFKQDLLAAARQLLGAAEGSFGLVLSTALDSDKELVVAARGQTMSVAFYPRLSLFTFGSESAATKAGLNKHVRKAPDAENTALLGPEFLDGYRFDLDDVNGEVMLLRWGESHSEKEGIGSSLKDVMRFGKGGKGVLRAATFSTGASNKGSKLPFLQRSLRLGGNPFVEPLPPMGIKDPVGQDIKDIPAIIRRIQEDWNEPSESLNRITAFTLLTKLKRRLLDHERGEHDGSVDLLVTGCEVSLWIGEQFASDLHNAFPKLKVVTLSANKLLAQLGQAFPVPNTGFYFNETSYNFENSCVLMLSHSGGTFATLNVSNLLKGYTPNLFVVTSEWDTQIARSVRAGRPGQVGNRFKLTSYVFTTFTGCRPAEPVSLTAVAMHQLLTQVLFYIMYSIRYHFDGQYPTLGGSTYSLQEVQELEGLNIDGLQVLEALVNPSGGQDAPCRKNLLEQGRRWSQHILEGPIVWILSAIYIAATVIAGATPLSTAAAFASAGRVPGSDEKTPCTPILPEDLADLFESHSFTCKAEAEPPIWITKPVAALDAVIYIFLPWWLTVVLRLVQGRPWLHRVAGRSLLIGDVPWVAQTLEAFVSKTFALSYSIASLSVASANPLDHLVHRHTHRVVRGSLLAVGRPDGRLNALTSAENTICLSVNQASSIQNYGVTCESITVGHNPFKLGLTANAIFIPSMRRPFMSEYVLEKEQEKRGVANACGMTASALMSVLSTAEMETFQGLATMAHGDRPEFIRKIEPLWGKGVLYEEKFIGAWMGNEDEYKGWSPSDLMEKQGQMQEIYEGRIASMQRLVAFLVMFHAMAKHVQDFWPKVSFGWLGYDMSRSQSIMRIATTASPVSGSDVRFKMLELAEVTARNFCASVLRKQWVWKRLEAHNSELDAKIAALQSLHDANGREPEISSRSTSVLASRRNSLASDSPARSAREMQDVLAEKMALVQQLQMSSANFNLTFKGSRRGSFSETTETDIVTTSGGSDSGSGGHSPPDSAPAAAEAQHATPISAAEARSSLAQVEASSTLVLNLAKKETDKGGSPRAAIVTNALAPMAEERAASPNGGEHVPVEPSSPRSSTPVAPRPPLKHTASSAAKALTGEAPALTEEAPALTEEAPALTEEAPAPASE